MRLWRTILDHLYPHWGNAHRPHILRRQWLIAFLGVILMCEAAIIGSALVHEGPSIFLAAVVRSDVLTYTAQARQKEGAGALAESELLDSAAQAKADDMAARGYFSHTGPDGEAPWVWITRAGYDYVFAGENLAVRFDDSRAVVDAWMASPTHRANIVKPQYQEIGVGIADGTYKGEPATFVVQFFASPKVASAPAAPVAADIAPPLPVAQAQVAGAETPAPAPESAPPAPQEPASPHIPNTDPSLPSQSAQSSISSETRSGATLAMGGIAALLVVVLGLTFFIRIQVQPTDLLLPGAAVALVAIFFLSANAALLPASQSASAILSRGGDIADGLSVERVQVSFPDIPNR